MKIKNEYINIKAGAKTFQLKNMILDKYIKNMIENQFLLNERHELFMKVILLKFENKLEFNEKSELNESDFDIIIEGSPDELNVSENRIVLQYTYPLQAGSFYGVYDAKTHNEMSQWGDYLNKKITAIGFATATYEGDVLACVNTDNYNIYINENEMISVTRRDCFSSDALFFCTSKIVNGPIHMIESSDYIYKYTYRESDNYIGILYSVGLSSYPDYIDKELVIGKDIEKEVNETEIILKNIENYIATNTFLYANETLYPDTSLYPAKSNYKYIIFKYKVYEYKTSTKDTGNYYYQAISIDKFGKMNLKIKYERG